MATPLRFGEATSTQTLTNNPTSPALPASGIENGDLGVWVFTALLGSTITLTGLTGGAAVAMGPATNGANAHQVWIVTKTLTTADAGLVVSGTLSSSGQAKVTCQVLRGGSYTFSAFALQQGSTSTPIPWPAITPTTDDSLLVGVGSLQFANGLGSQQTDPPSGWTEHLDSFIGSGTSRFAHLIMSKQLTGQAGVAQAAFNGTNSINHRFVGVIIAVAPTATTPPEPTPVDPTAVGMIGDSLTAQTVAGPGVTDMESRLLANGYTTAEVDGVQGRHMWRTGDTGGGTPAVLAAWAAANFNPYTLLIALETNPILSAPASEWPTQLASLRAGIITYLPGAHDVVFVDAVADPVGGLDMDRVIGTQGNSVAARNAWLISQLGAGERVISWNAYAKAHPTLSDPANAASNWQNDANEVHMNNSGYTLRNAFIADQMDRSDARTVTDTVGVSDAAARVVVGARALGDTAAVTDTCAVRVTRSRVLVDSITITDATIRTSTRARAQADALTVADVAARTSSRGRAQSDALTVADTAVRGTSRAQGLAEPLTVNDVTTRTSARTRAAADQVTIVDAITPSTTGNLARATTETLTITDAATRAATGQVRALAESTTITDVAVRAAAGRARTVSDATTVTDVAVREAAARARTAAEPILVADVAVRAAAGQVRTVTDVATFADAVSRISGRQRTTLEPTPITDITTRGATTNGRGLAEQAIITDTASSSSTGNLSRQQSETLTVSDALTRAAAARTRATAESLSCTDAAARTAARARATSDTVPTVDQVAARRAQARAAGDAINLVDATSIGTPAAVRTISESLSLAELTTLTHAHARIVLEQLTIVDTARTGGAAPPAPPERTLHVQAENRRRTIHAESRTAAFRR